MKITYFITMISLIFTCLFIGAAIVNAEDERGIQNVGYGDGSDGNLTVYPGSPHLLENNKNYKNVAVLSGAVIYTNGNVLRVYETLTNFGTITDGFCGGEGGSGGAGGDGGWGITVHRKPKDGHPGNEGDPGEPYDSRKPYLRPGGGKGGKGGGGGGGGGGAWHWKLLGGPDVDTRGGDGGDGGKGGIGGGFFVIYAYILDNQGVIHAGGGSGSAGSKGANGSFSEFYCNLSDRDQASGGGGGGAGGYGGDGGIVEIHYNTLLAMGVVEANGGPGGKGGEAGMEFGDQLELPACIHQHWEMGAEDGDGIDEYGNGGESNIGTQPGTHTAEPGCSDLVGTDGRVLVIPRSTDVIEYFLDIEIDPDDEWIGGSNVMHVRSLCDGLSTFTFRLDSEHLDVLDVSLSTGDHRGPWGESLEWNWLSDEITALVHLGTTYNQGDMFNLKVVYSGYPDELNNNGMIFDTQDGSSDPIAFTTVEPWFAYLWWPVKDDGENYNCDKATAELKFTVPYGMTAVSNGYLHSITTQGSKAQYEWRTNHEMAAYLVCVSVTDYDEIVLQSDITDVSLYVFPDSASSCDAWTRVTDMLELYSEEGHLGPYPFADEKYAIYQWPKKLFSGYGAMEHQTAVGQTGRWKKLKSGGYLMTEYQTCHELAHQWWGDLITCANWHNIFLNEGLACWTESFWFENQYCATRDPLEWPYCIIPNEKRALRRYKENQHDPNSETIEKTVYLHDDFCGHDSVNILVDPEKITVGEYFLNYKKAPWVLHMLRHMVDPDQDAGETPRFFEILGEYKNMQEPYGHATIPDFQAAAEAICADPNNNIYDLWQSYPGHPGGANYRDLDWFFEQWVYEGGAPDYRYRWDVEETGGQYIVNLEIEQVQYESGGAQAAGTREAVGQKCGIGATRRRMENPCFAMPIDLYLCRTKGPLMQKTKVTVWSQPLRKQTYVIPCEHNVRQIEFDPFNHVLKHGARKRLASGTGWLNRGYNTSEQRAVRVNELTQVVCASAMPVGSENATMWLCEPYYGFDEGLVNLGALDNDPSSSAWDINCWGQVVGDSVDSSGNARAFLCLPEADYNMDRGMHEIVMLGADSHARGINNTGQIVGYSGDAGNHHGVLWQYNYATGSSEVIELGTLENGSLSQALAINSGGQIVGWSDDGAGIKHAVVWDFDGETETWIITEDLGEGIAYCVNDRGVVGGQAQGSATIWVYDEDSEEWQVQVLGTGVKNISGSVVYGINDHATVVGEADGCAVLWRNGEMIDLNDRIGPNMAPIQKEAGGEWYLEEAWDIDNADRIVGWGRIETNRHAFLIIPPERSYVDCNTMRIEIPK